MRAYPCINHLSVPDLNVETEPRMQRHGDGKTEPMENLCQPLCTISGVTSGA